jgi:hypothetical protein
MALLCDSGMRHHFTGEISALSVGDKAECIVCGPNYVVPRGIRGSGIEKLSAENRQSRELNVFQHPELGRDSH